MCPRSRDVDKRVANQLYLAGEATFGDAGDICVMYFLEGVHPDEPVSCRQGDAKGICAELK